MRLAKLASSALGAAVLAAASVAGAEGGPPLPLKRVRLYETGVGYFERSGVMSSATADLAVPAGHLDDALKTLVVTSDDHGAKVSGVQFGSSVSPEMGRALAGLPDDTPLTLHALLRGLRGAEVVVKLRGASVAGRLVELVEEGASDLERCAQPSPAKSEKSEPAPCVPKKQATLVLLGKDGSLERLPTDEILGVRPVEKALAAGLRLALDALDGRSARLKKALRVRAKSGTNVSLGYIAETPVWRSSYRLVLASDVPSGTLQGWALLHNDTDENWSGVRVELVNGEPDSFVYPLAAPRYARRELVTPREDLATVPQLLNATADRLWSGDIGDSYGSGGLGLSGTGEGGGGRGHGVGAGRLGSASPASSALSLGSLAGVAQAQGVEAGALFLYTLAAPVDLPSRGSALVPFVSDAVAARRIASFTGAGSPARSAVHLVHRGTQTLPAGPIAVFADGGFAGEARLARMKPKQSALVEFGFDRDVELREIASSSTEEPRLVEFSGGSLRVHCVKHSYPSYEIENRSGSAREVFLKLSLIDNARVTGADELAYDSTNTAAFAVFRIGSRDKKRRNLHAQEALVRAYPFKHVTSVLLARVGHAAALPANQKRILLEARDRLVAAETHRSGAKAHAAELQQTRREILRLREHARALAADVAEPIAERLLAAEDRAKQQARRVERSRSDAAASLRAAERTLARLARSYGPPAGSPGNRATARQR